MDENLKESIPFPGNGFTLFFHFFLQVVIVGNGAVGKSSMIQRYCKGNFTQNYKKTIGVDFLEKHIT
jgi:GTP-binding protein EngB required for normal cell division